MFEFGNAAHGAELMIVRKEQEINERERSDKTKNNSKTPWKLGEKKTSLRMAEGEKMNR